MKLALIGFLICTLTAHSRPVQILTYQELQDRADVVVILKGQGITETDAKTGKYGFTWLCALSVLCGSAFATELKLALLCSDHTVLQRDRLMPVWRTAAPGDKITVGLDGERKVTSAP